MITRNKRGSDAHDCTASTVSPGTGSSRSHSRPPGSGTRQPTARVHRPLRMTSSTCATTSSRSSGTSCPRSRRCPRRSSRGRAASTSRSTRSSRGIRCRKARWRGAEPALHRSGDRCETRCEVRARGLEGRNRRGAATAGAGNRRAQCLHACQSLGDTGLTQTT